MQSTSADVAAPQPKSVHRLEEDILEAHKAVWDSPVADRYPAAETAEVGSSNDTYETAPSAELDNEDSSGDFMLPQTPHKNAKLHSPWLINNAEHVLGAITWKIKADLAVLYHNERRKGGVCKLYRKPTTLEHSKLIRNTIPTLKSTYFYRYCPRDFMDTVSRRETGIS
jgi:hypothetical protein